MPVLRAQVTIPATSGIPEDAVTNTWSYFVDGTADLTAATIEIRGYLSTFYEAWNSYRSLLQDWDAATLKLYNMSDTRPRAPINSALLGFTATAAASTLAGEVAVCMTFHGEPVSGQPNARKRGRVYLGPLAAVAADSSTGRPNTSFLTAIAAAGQQMIDDAVTGSTVATWVVHSHTIGSVPGTFDEDGISYTVRHGWVDNAWDTQRRRGMSPSNRYVFNQ